MEGVSVKAEIMRGKGYCISLIPNFFFSFSLMCAKLRASEDFEGDS